MVLDSQASKADMEKMSKVASKAVEEAAQAALTSPFTKPEETQAIQTVIDQIKEKK